MKEYKFSPSTPIAFGDKVKKLQHNIEEALGVETKLIKRDNHPILRDIIIYIPDEDYLDTDKMISMGVLLGVFETSLNR